MSTTNLIEISSSDSDFSLEYISDGEDVTPSIGESSHSRKLPHWASTDSSSQGQTEFCARKHFFFIYFLRRTLIKKKKTDYHISR